MFAPSSKIIEKGHALFGSSTKGCKRSVCVLLHRRWAHCKSSFSPRGSRLAHLDVDIGGWGLRLIAAHLPDARNLDDVYEVALLALEDVLKDGRETRRTNVVGLDANAVLGRRTGEDCASIVGGSGLGHRNHRGHIFEAWLHGQKLAVLNTMIEKPPESRWTHELWSTREQRQIDFLLIGEIRKSQLNDADVLDCLSGNSDHRGVLAELRKPAQDGWKQKRRRICVGWKPRLDEQDKPVKYYSSLDAVVTRLGGGKTDPTQLIVDAATDCTASARPTIQKHSEDVQALFAARRQESDPVAVESIMESPTAPAKAADAR